MADQSKFQNQSTDNGALIQLIIFRAADEEFGIPIEMVREIIKKSVITTIPNSPKFMKGIINVRGEIVVAVDMKLYFSLKQNKPIEEKHVVVTKQQDNLFGLLVDEVIEVLRIQKQAIQTPPNLLTKIHREFVSGVISHDGRLIILLDLGKMLSQKELIETAIKGKKSNGRHKADKDSMYEKNTDY